jgi:signal transduction histidine kinase/CheY-like chemotaxis protein
MQGDDEEKVLRSVALQNVQSILHARQRAEQELLQMKEALEEETRILELLNATGAKLASDLDLQSVVQTITDAATKLSGAEFGAFFYTVRNAEGGVLTLFTLSGAPREAFEKFGHPRDTALFGPTFRGEGVVRIADVRKDARFGQMAPHYGMPAGHLPVCSYLAVPVIARNGEVLGGLFFGHRDCNMFTERSERLIVGVAAQAAIAIDNAQLYEQAKRSAEERARLLEAERIARAEVERVSLMKDEFLATLSHELRTPLNAVLGWSELLLARSPVGSDGRRGLETISRNARAQAKLIEDLLDMNRIVSGKIRLDVQPVDLALVVSAAIDSVLPSAEAKAISIQRALDPDPGPVFGDPNRLQQVVWNLLSNAVKFTGRGGTIDVWVRRVSSHVEISVHDSGAGINADFLPHVFDRFRQEDSSSTRRYGGLGLGLSIVKQLVELHGGTVKAESAGEDLGATFVVGLPLHARSACDITDTPREHQTTTAQSLEPRASDVSLAGIAVLVVDDEADARELVEAALLGATAEVRTAASAAEALATLKLILPDVIVSDIGMPERDGYQLIRDVRSLPANQGGRTPAIALTAFARSEDRTRAMLAGYQVHVSKPIEPEELIATIKSLVGTHGRPA